MATITLKGNTIHSSGTLPVKGQKAPDFTLVKTDLSELSLKDLAGKKIIINIHPSFDTGVCAASVRRFNQLAAGMDNTVVLSITKDLPFAHSRFCSAEGINNVIPLSGFRDTAFGKAYGVDLVDGLFKGLYARSIVVINEKGEVVYTEQVPEIAQEPDYDRALAAL